MGALSDDMKKAGWPLVKEKNGNWTVYASEARIYNFTKASGWSIPADEIRAALDVDLRQIAQGQRNAITTLSRATVMNHTRNPSQPVARICKDGLVQGKRVLHLGTGLDRFARDALLKAGATQVCDYDPNFYPERSVLTSTYDVVVCNYVLNILPPKQRQQVYDDIARCTAPHGAAYICVQGKWPVLNKHRVIRAHEDGYLIRDTATPTFRKGYDPEELLAEIQQTLGGTAEVICMFYSNTLAQWHPAMT